MTTHRMSRSPTYKTWLKMKERCGNPNAAQFRWYGARGIRVCEAWCDSFEAFLADMGERPLGMTLDRVDSDRGYEPGNCRWADHRTQVHGQKRTRRAIIDGAEVVVAEVARRNGVSRDVATQRIRAGMSPENAVKKIDFRNPVTQDEAKRYRELKARGLRRVEIAALMGCATARVMSIEDRVREGTI